MLKTNIYFKVGVIVILVLLLFIPTAMIRSLIYEREVTQEAAMKEVSSKWAYEQKICGPLISIPYYKYVKETGANRANTTVRVLDYIHVLPNTLKVSGEISPEKRYRGIYEVVVYNSWFRLGGTFTLPDLRTLDIPAEDILLHKAEFVVGIPDLRGLEKAVTLSWNGQAHSFSPGVSSKDVVESGINTGLNLVKGDSSLYNFELQLDLKGSQQLYFTPVGKTTDIHITSAWPTPSFNGAFLPDTRSVSVNGFSADWNVLHLNRNYPQVWTGSRYSLQESSFGIDLLLPVDSYQKSYRSIRYAILFIVFTYLVFFFIEVLNRTFIHPVQYLLVGIGLVVFFTLLLSTSEHIPYNYAFILSAIATLLLIGGYVKAILKSTRLTMLLCGILTLLYTFIFVIIQLEDYALLIGSCGVFVILAVVMYLSRKIDWYNLGLGESVNR